MAGESSYGGKIPLLGRFVVRRVRRVRDGGGAALPLFC